MVAACGKWSVLLRGSEKVELNTDHNPLRWLRNQRDPRRTYARWIMELEEYNYEISYRPGIQNALPDYLSRIPRQPIDDHIQDEDIFEAKVFTIQHTSGRLSIMNKRQKEDPVTSLATEQLRRGKVVQGQLRRVNAHLHLEQDVLFFDARIVIPKSEQEQVLREVHAAGHFGQARTLESLRRNFFWCGMARDVKEMCRACITCLQAKPPMHSGNHWNDST